MKIVAALALALAAAAAAAALSARAADPTLTLAGPGAGPVVLLLAVAAALAGAGAASWRRRPRSATGPLLLFASVTWSAAQLATPAAPSATLFTVGLALGAATPAAVALALAPNRRAGAALALASAGLLGVLSALVFDPRASDCTSCPRNLLLVGGSEGLFDALQRAGLWLGLASIGWLLVSCAPRPRLAAVTAYLLAVAVQYTHSLARGYLAADPTDRALWTLQGLSLLAVAATVAWEPVGERRARARLARLVVELEARPGPRGLRDVLGEVLGDPELQIAYPLADGRRLDAAGRPVAPAAGQAVTALRDAELFHRPGLIADPEIVAAIAESAGLALRSERLQAELRARLEDLRAIRGRIVAAGDSERRAARARPPRRRAAAPRHPRHLGRGGAPARGRCRRRRAGGGLCGGARRARRTPRRRARARAAGARRRGTRRRGRGVRGDRRRPCLDLRAADGRALRPRGRGDRVPRAHRGGAARRGDATVRRRARERPAAWCRSTPPCRRERS